MPSVKKSFFWSGVEQVGPQMVTFVVGVVLARLLEPGDFGLLGMLALFMALGVLFSDSGLSSALIQRKEVTADDETSVFAMNVVAGGGLAVILCLISPLVARFYHQPILVPLLCVYSLSIVISSFGIVQSALFRRNMQFHTTAVIGIASTFVSGATGIVMAYLGCGVWSLVGSGISAQMVRTGLYWKMSKWRPRGKTQWQCIRSMWGYSSKLLYCGLIGVIYQNMYQVIIGRVYSAESLGYYNRANRLRMLPAGILTGIVNRVAFPLFSRVQNDKLLLLKRLRELIRVTFLLSAGGLTLLAVIADPLIPLLLTEKWRPVIPLLRILCYGGFLYPVHVLYLTVLQALGYAHLRLRLEIIKIIVNSIVIALVYRHGVNALAWSVVALMPVAYFLNAWYNVKLLSYHWRMQAMDLLPVLLICAISGWTAWWMGTLFSVKAFASLLIQAGTFGILFFCCVCLFRKMFFVDTWKHLTWGLNRTRQQFERK